jgi:hypothetical protein
VSAAPDIDAAVFTRDIAPVFTTMKEQMTVYASSRDEALKMSRNVHTGIERIGQTTPHAVIAKGVETGRRVRRRHGLAGALVLRDGAFNAHGHDPAPQGPNARRAASRLDWEVFGCRRLLGISVHRTRRDTLQSLALMTALRRLGLRPSSAA